MEIVRLFIIGLLGFVVSLGDASTIDQEKSSVSFSVKNMKVITVKGSFGGMKGEVNFDPSDLNNSSFSVCIDASSVDTGNKKRDADLLKENYFNVEKYKTICFKSISIKKAEDDFLTEGQLTMLGITRDVVIPFKREDWTLIGELKLNRLDYGLGKKTSKFMVADEISIKITCELNQ